MIRTATWTGNKRMIRCVEKCGFAETARQPHRPEYSVRGERLERIAFAITYEDGSAQDDRAPQPLAGDDAAPYFRFRCLGNCVDHQPRPASAAAWLSVSNGRP